MKVAVPLAIVLAACSAAPHAYPVVYAQLALDIAWVLAVLAVFPTAQVLN